MPPLDVSHRVDAVVFEAVAFAADAAVPEFALVAPGQQGAGGLADKGSKICWLKPDQTGVRCSLQQRIDITTELPQLGEQQGFCCFGQGKQPWSQGFDECAFRTPLMSPASRWGLPDSAKARAGRVS